MNSKFYLILAGLALVASVSCNKQLTPAENPETKSGRPVTLTASIGDPGTKLSYETNEDGTVLKGSWDAEEAVSVVLEKSAHSFEVYTFTYSGSAGQRTVTFSCEDFPELEEGDKLYIVYPAFEGSSTGSTGKVYYSKSFCPDGTPLLQMSAFSGTLQVALDGCVTQSANGDVSHLANATILYDSNASVDEDGNLSANLTPITSLFKVEMTFPKEIVGERMEQVQIDAYSMYSSSTYAFARSNSAEAYIYNLFTYGMSSVAHSYVNLYLGEWNEPVNASEGVTKGFVVPANGVMTVYIPFVIAHESQVFGLNDKFTGAKELIVRVYGAGTPYIFTGRKTLSKVVPMEFGKMYRLNVDLYEDD